MRIDFRILFREVSVWFKQACSFKNSWIFLPGLAAISLIYIADYSSRFPVLLNRSIYESTAIYLVVFIILILLAKKIVSNDPLILYLAVLALIFLTRELDDTTFGLIGDGFTLKTKKLVELLLVCMAFWGLRWNQKLFESLNRFTLLKVSIFGMLWTYFLSQLVAQRVFRGILPNEASLHVPLEEGIETGAHLFFLFVALVACYLISNKKTEIT